MKISIIIFTLFISFIVHSKEGVTWNNCVNKYCISKSTEHNSKLGLEITVFDSINNQSFWLVNNGDKKLCFLKKNKNVDSKQVSIDYCLEINRLFVSK